MTISDESADKFAQIYETEYGQKLTIAEAREMASRLVSLYYQLMQPLPCERTEAREAASDFPEESSSPRPPD